MKVLSQRRVLRHCNGSPWLLLLIIFLAADVLLAQPAEKPSAPSAAAPKSPVPTTPSPKPPVTSDGNWIFLPGPSGQKIPVPIELWREFLKWQATQRKSSYHVTAVSLAGEVDDGRALLDVQVEIQVQNHNEWIRIPLGLEAPNAVLTSAVTYKGPGEHRPDTDRPAADHPATPRGAPRSGLSWWLKGKGIHTLAMTLSAPVQREHPGHRLQLTLPQPAAAGTRLTLDIPGGPLQASTSDGRGQVQVTPLAGNKTRLVVHGIGERIDVAWRPTSAADDDSTVLGSTIAIAVEPNTDSVVLKAIQRVRVLKGTAETITVDLPTGYQMVDVEGDTIQDPQVDPDEPGRVHLPLVEAGINATDEPIEIRWTLQGAFPAAGTPLVLDGFRVEGARYQTGHLAMTLLDNYRTSLKSERFVHRTSARSLPRSPALVALFGTEVGSAWEVLRQPFRLELDLVEIEPRFVAEPQYFLDLSQDRISLIIDVPRAQVFRGAIESLEFDWPDWTPQGWQIDAESSPELQLRYDEPTGRLRATLPSRQTAADGRFSLRFRIQRPLSTEDAVPLTLPSLKTPTPNHPVLIIANAINVDSQLTVSDETAARPLSARLKQLISLPEELSESVVPTENYFRLPATVTRFQARITPQPRRVATESSVVAHFTDGKLKVIQRIDYDVKYARLGAVRLMVPRALQNDQVTFQLITARDAEPISLEARPGIEVGTQQQADIQLDEDRLNQFSVLASFEIDAPEVLAITTVPVPIPLLQCNDAAFSTTRFELTGGGGITAVLDDDTWKSELDSENRPVWRATGSPYHVDLALQLGNREASHHFTVPRVAIVQVLEDAASDQVQAWACFHIRGEVSTLSVRFPRSASLDRPPVFTWNGQSLTSDRYRKTITARGEAEFQLDVSRFGQATEHLLRIDYRSSDHSERGWFASRHEMVAPQLAEAVHVAETLWAIHLPVGHHLLDRAAGHSSRFTWRWQNWHFGRSTDPGFGDIAAWLTVPGHTSDLSSAGQGASYVFTKFGSPGPLVFRSISQWSLVLLGSGISLAAGLVLLYLPRSRHVLTFLAASMMVSLLAIWFADAITLLLQPGLLGLVLAGVAAVLHHRFGRRPSMSLAAFAMPNPRSHGSSHEISLDSPLAMGREPSTAVHRTRDDLPSAAATSPEPFASETAESGMES